MQSVTQDSGGKPFAELLAAVQDAGEDFEWYPTTDKMIDAVARWIDKGASSIMDVGAGDGRVLLKLGAKCEREPKLYAIEKSHVLIQSQPENVVPVGTDLFEQNLTCLPVDYLFSNPPYSQFELWATTIIETGYAKKAFLVIPRRWKDSALIADALKQRNAKARVIHSDDFQSGADRTARAVVDIVEICYPMKDRSYGRDEPKDPFDTWFDQNIPNFDPVTDDDDYFARQERTEEELAKLRNLESIHDMVAAYNEEFERMQENYRAIFRLDHELLRELGVKKDALREGIKVKMTGLKSKYWTILFERLDAVTSRLSTKTRERFLSTLTERNVLAFTANNAYAVVLWAIKNANQYFGEQTVQLFRDLATFEGVMKYKSNQRTWGSDAFSGWRYRNENPAAGPSRFALDYRIVVDRYRAITGRDGWAYDSIGHLDKSCHEMIDDVIAVLGNLGFTAIGFRSRSIQWTSGQWQDWHRNGTGEVLFQVKAFKNGNLHFRFMPDAIKAINVEAGRLLGWLHSAKDVETELGYTPEESKRFFNSTKLIAPSSVRMLAGIVADEPDAAIIPPTDATTAAQVALF